jgi:hypothetical protein
MKYVGFYEMNPEDFAKVIPKFMAAHQARTTDPDKFPKIVLDTHSISAEGGKWKGLTIYEDPTEEQMTNLHIHYHPEVVFQFVPMIPAASFIQQFLKAKK